MIKIVVILLQKLVFKPHQIQIELFSVTYGSEFSFLSLIATKSLFK